MTIFYIVAAGPSYMDVTEDEWKFLEDKHTLTFTRVPYGSRKFEYYMSIEREQLDRSVLTYMAELGYFDTKLLLSIPESLQLARNLGFKHIKPIIKQNFYFLPSRRPWFEDEEKPPHSFSECRAKSFRQPIFRFRGQLSATINCALILGATEIRLIAVDLNSQKNWYQDENNLRQLCKSHEIAQQYIDFDREVHDTSMLDKKAHYPAFDEETMHSTDIPTEEINWKRPLKGISDVLKWIDEGMVSEGMEGIFITNKDSKLYKENKLRFKEIIDD